MHFRSDDPPDSIGWKLAAVNLSDLAAKGATPIACLMNYALSGDAAWDAAFLRGLGAALDQHAMPLIGGDTVAMPTGSARSFGLTAIGSVAAACPVPSRAGGRPGDLLYVSGPVGDAGAGLWALDADPATTGPLVDAYRRPRPDLALGQRVAPLATATMDISDGLLIDVSRLADASGCAAVIDHIPLSDAYRAAHGDSIDARLRAATAGDDYVILAAIAPDVPPPDGVIAIGRLEAGSGLSLILNGTDVSLPKRLGYLHGA